MGYTGLARNEENDHFALRKQVILW